MSRIAYNLDDHTFKPVLLDGCGNGYGDGYGCGYGGWRWGSWSIFIIILIGIIAFIWQRNHDHKICDAKEMGALNAKVSYDHQALVNTKINQRQDEIFMYGHVDPRTVPTCKPCHDYGYGCGPNYGPGYGGYGPGYYGPNYGNCGYGGYGYPGPGFLVNGYPPYQVPETKFQKTTAYKQCGHSDILETAVV